MHFKILRDQLWQGLQFASGVIERRQNIPVLANVLLQINDHHLSFVGTDLELELTSHVEVLMVQQAGEITASGRKLMDICRTLPEGCEVTIYTEGSNKLILMAGKSRFTLATLPAADFPLAVTDTQATRLSLSQAQLVKLLDTTHFAMAQQDVRFYLNGLFFELTTDALLTVATDGHRLALQKMSFIGVEKTVQFIVPRKGIMELLRLLNKDSADTVTLYFSANAIKIESEKFVFVSRLIDGRFPDYHRVIPKNGDKSAIIDRDALRQVLQRAAILTNEKYHAVKLLFQPRLLTIHATNMEQEEAQDELVMDYEGPSLEFGFNVNYLLDVLSVLPAGNVRITFSSPENSVLIDAEALPDALFVIMPMCL